ncbi:MAG: phosphoenolpyruvate--protein phosphotransferase [Candidatus Promineifilaceae bacterium]
MKTVDLVIQNPTGLHARPAKTFVKLAKGFKSTVKIAHGDKQVNGKSLIGVLKLGIKRDGAIRLLIDGSDESEAIHALVDAVKAGLGETLHTHEEAPSAEPQPISQPQPSPTISAENTITGIPASSGVGIGPVWQLVTQTITIGNQFLGREQETAALHNAMSGAREQITTLRRQTAQQINEAEAAIFDAHLELLSDPDLLDGVLELISAENSAAQAWDQTIEANANALASLSDPLLAARAADMRDVGQRVLAILTGQDTTVTMPADPFILCTNDLSPSLTASLDKRRVLAICTAAGGANAHAAILARALRLPAVVGAGSQLLDIASGTTVIVNGVSGQIALSPNEDAIAEARQQQEALQASYQQAMGAKADPAITTDGHRIEIVANVGNVADAEQAYELGAEGVGLLRSEFLFLERESAPTIEEQTQVVGDILAALRGQPVIVRTLDVGGDKPLSYIDVPHEDNPFLGERGIRLCLNRPKLLREQLTAIVKASERGKARIMFPMVSDISELQQARQHLNEIAQTLGIAAPEVGIMIEVPSAALMADVFAPHVDFFSIGTNDLTQYTMAVDRMHPSLNHLSDGLHPAVLRLISKTVDAAHAAGKWVGVCGELGADPQAVPILIGLGVDELSVNVPAVPTVKAQIRTLSMADCKTVAQRALVCPTAQAVRNL